MGRGKVSIPSARVVALREFRKLIIKSDMRAYLGTVGITGALSPDFLNWLLL